MRLIRIALQNMRFMRGITLSLALGIALVVLFFSACATRNIQPISISTQLIFDDAMREVCWRVESQEQCFEMLLDTCEAGNYRNCTLLGNSYALSLDYSNYHEAIDKANDFLQKACDGKNGSGCFMLGLYNANKNYVIRGCEYGDFLACHHIVINRDSFPKSLFASNAKWALEREIELLETECKNAELRLQNEKDTDRIAARKLVLTECQEYLHKAKNMDLER